MPFVVFDLRLRGLTLGTRDEQSFVRVVGRSAAATPPFVGYMWHIDGLRGTWLWPRHCELRTYFAHTEPHVRFIVHCVRVYRLQTRRCGGGFLQGLRSSM